MNILFLLPPTIDGTPWYWRVSGNFSADTELTAVSAISLPDGSSHPADKLLYLRGEEAINLLESGCVRQSSTDDSGCDDLAAIAAQMSSRKIDAVTLIIPAADILLQSVPVAVRSKRQLEEAVLWELEEQLSHPPEELHFALGKPAEGHIETAVVSRALLDGWLEMLDEVELTPDFCFAEQQLLPAEEDTWNCYYDAQAMIIRTGSGSYYSDKMMITALTELLFEEQPPAAVNLQLNDESLADEARELLPAALQMEDILTLFVRTAPFERLAGVRPPFNKGFNLLQGQYSPAIDWSELWGIWRPAAVTALATVILGVSWLFLDVQAMRSESDLLNSQGRSIYAGQFPNEPWPGLSAADQQFNQLLTTRAAVSDNDGASQLGILLYRVGNSIKSVPRTTVVSLNYKHQTRQLQLEFDLDQYGEIQRLRDSMKQQQLQTRVENSRKVKNRLRVKMLCSLSEDGVV